MFDKYSANARRALFFSRYEAGTLGSPTIDPEHLLLGILRENEPCVADVFDAAAVSPETIRGVLALQAAEPVQSSRIAELRLSNEARQILYFATNEAETLLSEYVTGCHILLGMLRLPSSRVGQVLSKSGIAPELIKTVLSANGS